MLQRDGTIYTPSVSQWNASTGTRYWLPDALGSLRNLRDSGEGLTTDLRYDGFGNNFYRNSADQFTLGFAATSGYQYDSDTGFLLLGNRYYDPAIGRFLSPDPIGAGSNWYEYCGNDPLSFVDPTGMTCQPFDSSNMSFSDIYEHVCDNGGEPGEEYQTKDKNGKVMYDFTVSGFSFNGTSVPAPYGVSIDANIMAARNFYNSKDSQSFIRLGGSGRGGRWQHDPTKIKNWLVSRVATNHSQDYKLKGKKLATFDLFGHANYAAMASELHIDYTAILIGQQYAHETKYPGSALEWSTAGESLLVFHGRIKGNT